MIEPIKESNNTWDLFDKINEIIEAINEITERLDRAVLTLKEEVDEPN